MRTLTPLPSPAPPRTAAGRRSWLARSCEAVLDASVAVLATWTVVYHLCLVLRLGVPWAVGLELAALVIVAVGWRRFHRPLGDGHLGPEPGPGLAVSAWSWADKLALGTAVGTGALAAVLVAVGATWSAVSALWLASAVGGTVLAVRRARGALDTARPPLDRGRGSRGGEGVALAWAPILAVLSLFARRSNPDDLYYVNLSQWVVEHGTFPVRDTIFSDLVYPMSSWPPIASYDGLAGTVAHLVGVHAASVVYLVVPPLVTFLSVLALWRLLREWRVEGVGVALSLALVFLLFDGGPGYAAPGNLFLTRIWQGKVILLCLAVPTLLVYALRYVDRPTAGRAGWLFAGGVAASGLSTSAMFLVPLLALAGAAPLVVRRSPRAVTGLAAMAAYPLATGVVTLALGGRSADFFGTRRLFRFDPAWFGPEIFRQGPFAAIAVAAVLAAALILPRHAARVITAVSAVIVGITFVPGVTQLSFDLVGLGPTLWRVSWITPIAALVGVLGVRLAAVAVRRSVRAAIPAALAVLLAVSGVPIWTEANGVGLDRTPQWKLSRVEAAEEAIDAARPGDIILAPQPVAVTITVLTTEVKTVAPRDYFMDYLRDEPGFFYEERQTLLDFVNEEFDYADRPEVARALDVVGVDQVCVPIGSPRRTWFLRVEDYEQVTSSPTHRCFRR